MSRFVAGTEKKFEGLFEAASDATVVVNHEGKIVLANAQAEALLGYERKQLLGSAVDMLLPERFRKGHPAHRENFFANRSTRAMGAGLELFCRHKDGHEIPVEIRLGSFGAEGRVLVSCAIRDITERKKAEEALLFKTALLEAQSETTIDGILAVDETSHIVLVNKQFGIHFRVPEAMLASKDDRIVLAHIIGQVESPEAFSEKVAYLYKHRDERSRDEFKLKSGKTFERYSAPLIDSNGRYWGRIWYFRDITERKQAEESLKLFRLLVDQSNDAILVIDSETLRLFDVNARACSSLGYTREELLSMRVSDIDPSFDEQAHAKTAERLQDSGFSIIQSIQRRKDGSTFPVEVSMRRVHFDRDYGVCAIRDISERKQMEIALEEANAKLRIALGESEEQAREAIKLTELVDILQSCQTTEEAYRIIGDTLPTTLSSPSGALCMTSPSRNIVETVAAWGAPITEKTFAPDDCWALRRGRTLRVNNAASPMRCAHVSKSLAGGYLCVPLAAQGETLGVLCLENPALSPTRSAGSREDSVEALARQASDVAERISLVLANLRVRQVLRSQSIRDPLTGLFNRRFMEESLEREVRRAARNNEGVALLMLDIDRFKLFNDTYGHQAGDMLLREFGDFLNQGTRGQDVACRYGGEEFLLVLSGASVDAACKRAELLREDLKQLAVRHAGQVLGKITVSIGVSAFPDHGATVEELVSAADKALYRAKEQGRNRVVVASAAITGS